MLVFLIPVTSPATTPLVILDAHSGAISPPMDTTPRVTTQTITGIDFEYAGLAGTQAVEGTGVCSGSTRSSGGETLTSGSGSGSFSCSLFGLSGGGTAACSFTYARTGPSYLIPNLTCTWSGAVAAVTHGQCELVYAPIGVPASGYEAVGSCVLT